MKKIIALILVLSLSLLAFAACGKKNKNDTPDDNQGNVETPDNNQGNNDNNNDNNDDNGNQTTGSTYYLALVTDGGFGTISKSKVTNITLAIVFDAEGKIVAAQFDSVEASVKITNGEITTSDRLETKVEQGDNYAASRPMPAGSWDAQSAAFEAFLVGKTAAEVAALDVTTEGLVAGCTMASSMPVFQQLVAKAAAYERKVEFKAEGTFTLGLAIDAKLTGSVEDGAKVAADFAAVVAQNGKVVAAMLDSAEASFTFEYDEAEEEYTTEVSYKGSKNDQGDAYDAYSPMPSGRWYAQAQAFANTAVGKTATELANLSTDKIEGSCSIYTGGYKATIIRAATNANLGEVATEATYYLVLVTDAGFGTISKSKVTNITLALVIDSEGKIVAAQFDSVEASVKVTDDEITTSNRLETKVEQGDNYAASRPMPAGSWDAQSAAFEAFLVGKTAAEVAALDVATEGLVAGCTMASSMPVFQQLVAKAFAYERKVEFTTAEEITLGLAIDAKLTGSVEDGAKVAADFAAVAIAGGKVVAAMLDSAEASFTFEYDEAEEEYTTTVSYKGSKNDQGDAYDAYSPMPSGRWYAQAQAFADTAVGKTAAELEGLSTDKIEGSCSIYTGGYKATIVRAAGNAN